MVSKNGRLLTTAGKIRGTKDMKKLYSKQLGSEVYALAPEQLKVFASSGYEVPTPEAVIADAGAIRIVPPAGKRAYAVFKFTTGAFVVRTSAETMTMQEVGASVRSCKRLSSASWRKMPTRTDRSRKRRAVKSRRRSRR